MATLHRITRWIGHELDVALDTLEGPHDNPAQWSDHPPEIGDMLGGSI